MTDDGRRTWGHRLVLLLFLGLAYANTFVGVFQFDDYNVIVDNRLVRSWTAWADDWAAGHGQGIAVRPLLKASYTLNWTSGLGLFGFHLVNLLIHAINVLLVYALSRKLLDGSVPSGLGPQAALLTALLFALHPVQTEAVTYVSGRSSSLMALFYLGSLLAYLHGTERHRPIWLYGISPCLFLCSLATKEVAATLPVALLLWESAKREPASWRAMLRRQAAHWVVLAAALGFLLVHPRYAWLLTVSLGSRSIGDNLLTQIHGIAYLLSRLAWLQALNIDPDLPVIAHWTAGLAAEAGALLLLLALGLTGLRRRPVSPGSPRDGYRVAGFGLLWFFLHLLPTNSLVPRLDAANERQLYLSGWGLYLALAVALTWLVGRHGLVERGLQPDCRRLAGGKIAVQLATVLLVLVLAGFTIARNHTYRSEIALWEDTAHRSPHKARVFNNLGYAYALAGRYDSARDAYRTALRLDPHFELAGNNLAMLPATKDE